MSLPCRVAFKACLRSSMRRRQFSSGAQVVPMIIDGKEVQSKATEFFDVHNPATGEVIARTPLCTQSEMDGAADSCAEAYKSWKNVPPSTRARVMHKLEASIKDSTDEIAA